MIKAEIVTTSKCRNPPPTMTRKALVLAALKLFGPQGFDGTSTREIAAARKANIGSIAYHFGGKDGLRAGLRRFHRRDHPEQSRGPAWRHRPSAGDRTTRKRPRRSSPPRRAHGRPSSWHRPEAGEIVQFVLRELAQPDSRARPHLLTACSSRSTSAFAAFGSRRPESRPKATRTKLTVFTMIGQVVYFRIGRVAVLRRMGWTDIGPGEASAIIESSRPISMPSLDAPERATNHEYPLHHSLCLPHCFRPARRRRRSPSAMSRANSCCWRLSRLREVETVPSAVATA